MTDSNETDSEFSVPSSVYQDLYNANMEAWSQSFVPIMCSGLYLSVLSTAYAYTQSFSESFNSLGKLLKPRFPRKLEC